MGWSGRAGVGEVEYGWVRWGGVGVGGWVRWFGVGEVRWSRGG